MPDREASRFRALDGWRGVCALLVAAHHVEAHGFLYWQPVIRSAWLFVDFFFVLSGFVIAHAYGDTLGAAVPVRRFVGRRLGRLWPLHVAMLLALVLFECAHLAIEFVHPIAGERMPFAADRAPSTILTNLLLIQSLGLYPFETWNGPAWSISTEFWTYLVFAAVCLTSRGRAVRLVLSALLALGGLAVLMKFSNYGMRETFGFGFFRCLYGFFTGVLIRAAWQRAWIRRLSGTFAEVAAVAAVAMFVTWAPQNRAAEYFAPFIFAFAVVAFAGDRGLLSHALQARFAAALGRWSYSIYMTHTVVLVAVFSAVHMAEVLFGEAWLLHLPDGNAVLAFGRWNDLVMLAILVVVVAVSSATYRWIERPGQALFARLSP